MKIENHRLLHDDGTPYPFRLSPNTDRNLVPSYLLIHYTAGRTASAAVQVLTDPRPDAPDRRVSAHLVIGRDGEITQLVPFNMVAWHAGYSYWEQKLSMNRHSIGIELDHEGYVKKVDGAWTFKGQPTAYTDADVEEKVHWKHFAQYGWLKYPQPQIDACLEVSRLLVQTYGLKDILGHEDVHQAKVDPGPTFPMQQFRMDLFKREETLVDRYEARQATTIYKNLDGTAPKILPQQFSELIPKGTKVEIQKTITNQKRTEVLVQPKKKDPDKKPQKVILKEKISWSLVKIKGGGEAQNLTGYVLSEHITRGVLNRSVELFKEIHTNPGFGFPIHPGSPLPQGVPVRLLSVQGKWALVATLAPTPKFKFLWGWVRMGDLMLVAPKT